MGKIKKLEANIINLIAAGEVVERPASVVKELVENSIDAGADKIIIHLEGGGTTKISVQDNGAGMDTSDAELAFEQHATSKIYTKQDLESIGSLGFRGEALASISSVAQIAMETRSEGNPAVGIKVAESAAHTFPSSRGARGTSITVTNLFGNLPARQKFLRTPATELTHTIETFIGLALTHLNIHFELQHNNKLLHRLPITKKLEERIYAIWGAKVAEQLYSSKVEQGDVSGRIYIGKPDIARKDRKLQYIFINKRHISNRLLQKAINDGFKGFIHRDLQPVYFLFLELPPAAVDVNVHPRKQEVKFQQPQAIYSAVLGLVRHLLTTSTKQDMLDRFSSSSENGARELPNWNLKDRGINRETYAIKGSSNISQVTKPIAQSALDFSRELLAGQSEQTSKPGDAYEYYSSGSRYTQLFGTYIVYQQADEVLFVDQHAAAEKILYEKLSTQPAAATSNPLLVPEILELEQQDKKAILEARDELSRLGIKLADFGGNSVQVTSKPSLAPNLDVASFWQEVRSESIDLEQVKNLSNPGEVDLALATMACHGSIRAGQPLSQPEMGQLISDLLKCNTPYNCPHGRPVSWSMSRTELEKHFKRIL